MCLTKLIEVTITIIFIIIIANMNCTTEIPDKVLDDIDSNLIITSSNSKY